MGEAPHEDIPKTFHTVKRCQECLAEISDEDYEYWGECQKCRPVLPIKTKQTGDREVASQGQTDRDYHGGNGSNAEW